MASEFLGANTPPPVLGEAVKPPVTIRGYQPSELDDTTIERLGLDDVFRESGDMGDEDARSLAKELFREDNPSGKLTYVAENGGQAIGYTVLNRWDTEEAYADQPSVGRSFARWLDNDSPEIADALGNAAASFVVVSGAATAQETRGLGIQKAIWEQMAADLNPTIVLGDSANPAAVAARAHALAKLGYRTFFGDIEVTPGADPDVGISGIAAALSAAYTRTWDGRDGLFESPSQFAAKDLPDLSGFSSEIQRSSERLQADAPEGVAVTQTLVSVKSELLGYHTARS